MQVKTQAFLIVIVLWTAVILVSARPLAHLWELRRSAATARGFVVAVDPSDHNRATYSYRINGVEYTNSSVDSVGGKGASVTVYYLPSDPSVSVLANPVTAFRENLVGTAILCALIAVGALVAAFRARQHRAAMSFLAASFMAAACLRVGTQERRLIVLNAGTQEQRIRSAQEYATKQRLVLLRADVRKSFPDVNDLDLQGLELSWQVLGNGAGGEVVISVLFTAGRPEIDAKSIADYAATKVRGDVLTELRPTLK